MKSLTVGYKPFRIRGGTYSGEFIAQRRSGMTKHGVRAKSN
jgi:hypothetical protein